MRILIADDDKQLKKILIKTLADFGLAVAETDSGTKALQMLGQEEYDVLLLDLNMPKLGRA